MILLLVLLAASRQEPDRVHVDAGTGEILLAARNSVLRDQSDPSKFDVVTDMVVYRGRLLASACMDFDETSLYQASAYSGAAQVLEFAADRQEWTVLRDLPQSMLFNLRVVGDALLLPEYFPMNERSRRIHTFDGGSWGELGLLPAEAWHIMDVIRIGERLYASGSWRDLDPAARKSDPNWFKGYGHVFESGDGGRTWRDLRRTTENGRILDIVEFRGKLHANERGLQLIAWDGRQWEEIPVRLEKSGVDAKLGSAHLMVFADRVVAINADLYYTYDGKKWASYTPGYIDLWREGRKLYGLRKDGSVWVTDDAARWTAVTKEGVPAREFDRQAAKGRPIHRGALALHRGRLFVGTSAGGKIYAAPYEEKGSWVSRPEKFEAGAGLQLAWEAHVPAACALVVRTRTAESSDELEKASWKEAASPGPIALPRRHRWAQLRAELSSDGRATPILRRLALAKEP